MGSTRSFKATLNFVVNAYTARHVCMHLNVLHIRECLELTKLLLLLSKPHVGVRCL